VLDTNVLVSAMLSPHRAAAQVLDLVTDGVVTALLDDRIAAEYREAMRRPRFGFDAVEVERVLDTVEALAERVTARPLTVTLPDADGLPFLEVAVAGHADMLVTGNARHFVPTRGVHAVSIRSPRDLLDTLRTES
jgi:putative PIN family toxin of toxin-antitoxin system